MISSNWKISYFHDYSINKIKNSSSQQNLRSEKLRYQHVCLIKPLDWNLFLGSVLLVSLTYMSYIINSKRTMSESLVMRNNKGTRYFTYHLFKARLCKIAETIFSFFFSIWTIGPRKRFGYNKQVTLFEELPFLDQQSGSLKSNHPSSIE